MTLRKLFLDEDLEFKLPADVEDNIGKSEFGTNLTGAIKEMSVAIKQGMARSALNLSTYIIEGFIRDRAKKMGKWDDKYSTFTFGDLLNDSVVKSLINPGLLNKLNGLNQLRIPSSHFKGTDSIIPEARIGAQIVLELAKDWFKGIPAIEAGGSPK